MTGFTGDAGPGGGTSLLEDVRTESGTDTPWTCEIYNDPKNSVDYVTLMIVKICEVDKETAERFMWTAHTEGQAAVFSGEKDKCTAIAGAFKSARIWAKAVKS